MSRHDAIDRHIDRQAARHQASIDADAAREAWIEFRTVQLMNNMDIEYLTDYMDSGLYFDAIKQLLILRRDKSPMPQPLAGIVEQLYHQVEGLMMDEAEREADQ